MQLTELLQHLDDPKEAGILQDLLSEGVVRPLGHCGCNASRHTLKPSQRASQAVKGRGHGPIASARCTRCQAHHS
eukprot:8729996-Pyramimonas_sp.AAC.1